MHLLDTLALLACALIFAKLIGGVARRYGVPSVLIELLTGVLIGNWGGPFLALQDAPIVQGLSELGVLLLLFLVGLETDLAAITRVGKDATMAAFVGVVAPFALAFGVIPLVSSSTSFNHTLFMAAALTATSVGITARVLQDLGKLKSVSGQIILGAAVIDDVLGIIVLTVVSALVTQGTVSAGEVGSLLAKIALFGVGIWALRRFVLPHAIPRIRFLEVSGTVTILLLSLTLILAWSAEKMGLAGIIGAFALGLALDDVHFKGYKETGELRLEHLMKPITDFLVPIFFIVMGMSVKLEAMANRESLTLAGVLIVLAVLGKLACGLAVSSASRKRGGDRLLVGYGMIPRGEVGLIFAAMGLKLGVLGTADYGAVVAMVAVTTLAAPFLIGMRSRRV